MHPRLPFKPRLCLGDGTADLGTTLAGGEAGLSLGLEGRLGTLLDLLLGLGEDKLDVAGAGHVGVDLRKLVWYKTKKKKVDAPHTRPWAR